MKNGIPALMAVLCLSVPFGGRTPAQQPGKGR
jgi:hypothetical protein